jgi:arylsulfatase A-like enzyme
MSGSPDSSSASRRSRRWLVTLAAIAVALMLIVMGWYAFARGQRQAARHVIVISLDTTRVDHLGCYGNPWIRTPSLDALAADSIRFTNYITAATSTLASHVSLFTGNYPHTHGVPRNGFVVHPDNRTMAEILQKRGFHTAAFVSAFALASRFGIDQGFDHFDEDYDVEADLPSFDQNERSAQAVTDAALAYLDEHGVPERLFLFVHYFDPHEPYDPPPPYDAMYGLDAGAPVRITDHPVLSAGSLAPEHRPQLQRYAGEVSHMDAQVGRLLAGLRQRGILDDAILIVTSDHGENLGDKPGELFNHGWTTYQIELAAVALVRLPNARLGGTTFAALTASVDVLPTLLHYLGLPLPEPIDGEPLDLLNLGVPDDQPRVRFGEATKPWWERVESDPRWRNMRKQRCVRVGRYKLIQTPYKGTEELYDLTADPHERNNLLAPPNPALTDTVLTLRQVLKAWAEQADPLPSHFEEQAREETIRRLKALGYLVPEESTEDD